MCMCCLLQTDSSGSGDSSGLYEQAYEMEFPRTPDVEEPDFGREFCRHPWEPRPPREMPDSTICRSVLTAFTVLVLTLL